MDSKLKYRGIVLTIISAVVYGLSPLFSLSIYHAGGTPLAVTTYRMAFSAAAMAVLHLVTSRVPLMPTHDEFKKIMLASLPYAVNLAVMLSSYNYLSSGLCATLHFAYPLYVLIGGAIFLHQKISLQKAVCCALCAVGILSFYTPSGEIRLLGVLLAGSSAIIYASYVLFLSSSGLVKMPPFKLCCWLSFFSMFIDGAFAFFGGQMVFRFSPRIWGILFLFSLMAGCVAMITFQLGARYVGAQSASLIATFEPLTSIFIGVLVYHEVLTGRSLLGIVCILVSVVLMSVWNDA